MGKRLISLFLTFLLVACQGSGVATLLLTSTPVPSTATFTLTETPKPTSVPEPTSTPVPTATLAPVERLVFEEGRSAVFINSDGSGREELVLLPPDSTLDHLRAIQPSPDGNYLAFGAFIEVPTASQIYSPLSVINITSQSTSEVVPEWGSLVGVSWAPDGVEGGSSLAAQNREAARWTVP